ncbi:MAG: hypothetical protein IJZ53_06430 [Tyzzerella sp.]|nr:hypothetical protein [Tyzzerella sp.]
MKRLSKKQIIIIISVAIVIIALAIAGIIFGLNYGKKKETTKNDDKIESVETDKTDEEEKETDTENDETSVVEDESKKETTTEETPEVEEPKSETPKTETPSNTNQNQNNTNTGSNTGNSGGGTTTPSTPVTPTPTPEPEKSPYAGMYAYRDEASKTRFATCGNILRGGLAGQYIQVRDTFIDYFNGNIVMINGTTDNAWMYFCIGGWSTDAQYAVGLETEPGYKELPSLAKQCMVTIAPEGGEALYNTINSLILQYGGPRKVPTQGRISESIPGLYVTVTQGRSGLEIEFWAE